MDPKSSDLLGMRKTLRQPLFFLLDLYAAAMVAYLILRIITTDHYWPVELVSVIAHWLLLLAILLLPIAIWARRRQTTVLLFINAVAFILLFGGLFLPRGLRKDICEPDDQSMRLTVMTYNISNGLASPESIIEIIGKSGADIVALQEMTFKQKVTIQRGLEELFPYQSFHGTGIPGIGILSQYPIMAEELFTLQGTNPYLRVRIQIEDKMLTVMAVHPPVAFGPGGPESPSRADMPVLGELAIENEAVIMLGDLNVTDQNEGYNLLMREGLTDVFRAAGWGFGLSYPKRTWSGSLSIPLIRIDYIMVTEDLCPIVVSVGEDGGSDHLPVLAVLMWKSNGMH
jgi:endonuclease/exonuclease/phosphatase family metal-dependent hydrolase